MGRGRRITRWVAAGVVLLLVAGLAWSTWTVRRSFPQTGGELVVDGLSAPVDVLRDEYGVPQLYADTAEDLFFAQGFVHAQDRFFEMDVRRHVTAGRLAELVGDGGLETDVYVRSLGWYDVAAEEVALLSPSARAYLEAYADGVNAYVRDRAPAELSLEYAVLGLTGPDYVPEPWTPTDSLAWLKALAWDLRSNATDEIARSIAAGAVGTELAEQLYPAYPTRERPPILDTGTVVGGRFDPEASSRPRFARPPLPAPVLAAVSGDLAAVAARGARVPELLGTGEGVGSNSWVLAGEHTASGAPILANDPHLANAMPGIWEQMGLHCRDVTPSCPFDVSGTTFSGLPGVVIGHTDRVAWGLTTMYADVADLYVERVRGDEYLYDGEWLQMSVREEEFLVAGEDEPVTETVRATRRGPLLSDVDDDAGVAAETAPVPRPDLREGEGYAVSLQWTALQPGRTMDAVFGFDRAGSWEEFRAAAKLFEVPSQNLVYADVEGHVGYQAPGTIPVRRLGDGRWPAPGWDARYGWRGTIPFRQLPWVLDPPGGVIVTANQQVVDPRGYPYPLGEDTSYGYRAQRIRDLLAERDDWTVEATSALQQDTLHPFAGTLVPLLLEQRLASEYQRDGQELLAEWDGAQAASSAAAAYFNVVWGDLLALTFHDQLPEAIWPEGGERWYEVVGRLLDEPRSDWWDDVDTAAVEDRDDVLAAALRQARDDMTRMQAADPAEWRWGALHGVDLENQTLGQSGVAAVEAVFNRGPYEVGGSAGAVNATSWEAPEGYETAYGPSTRLVVPLDDLDAARWVVLGGTSGHAFSAHYADQTELWARGETIAWPFGEEAVAAAAEDELSLVPADADPAG